MSGDELGRGPYTLRPHSLTSVLFRTMLTQVADRLTPEEVSTLAYIYLVRIGEAMTALSLLRELEMKGLFSANDVEPLEEVLGSINRYDLVHTIKKFKAKLKGEKRGRPCKESAGPRGVLP